MFADDTSLTYANADLKKLETEIKEELFNVCLWLAVNKLTLNIEKTNYVIFRPRQKTIPFHPNIKIINNNSNTTQPLEMKNYISKNVIIWRPWPVKFDVIISVITRGLVSCAQIPKR